MYGYYIKYYFYSQELISSQEEALQIFEKVDILLEGTSKEHEVALHLLTSYENEVFHIFFCYLLEWW